MDGNLGAESANSKRSGSQTTRGASSAHRSPADRYHFLSKSAAALPPSLSIDTPPPI